MTANEKLARSYTAKERKGDKAYGITRPRGYYAAFYRTQLADLEQIERTNAAEQAWEAATALTLEDLDRALADERHLGWGWATSHNLGTFGKETADQAVIDAANALGCTYEDLFAWANSRNARWALDHLAGTPLDTYPATIARYLNRARINELRNGLESDR